MDEKIGESALPFHDKDWYTNVELHARIRPDVKEPQTYELDYGLKDGVLVLTTKKALTRFVMAAWQIAPENDSKIPSNYFPLVLEREVLIDN
ncbi:MAG: hypothetical protein GJ680_21220 [Alteromonadaceae bacterium]|nr:hypothetical protein [Alteromonadaceae bacterium]